MRAFVSLIQQTINPRLSSLTCMPAPYQELDNFCFVFKLINQLIN